MSSGFLMLTGDEESPLTIVHDSVIETDPAHDLTHLAPEVGDSHSFPLDLDNLPAFDGFDMEDLLSLTTARSSEEERLQTSTTGLPAAGCSVPSASSPSSIRRQESLPLAESPTATDSAFSGSSPFSLDSRSDNEFSSSSQPFPDGMSNGNCSPFSLESNSSDQYNNQPEEQQHNQSLSGAEPFVPFSLESLVSDVVVSSPGEEDPDFMMPFRSSSIGDSPLSSSKSFDCDSDLDLYSNCNADLRLFTDDTFLDSLLTSSLSDGISTSSSTCADTDVLSSFHSGTDVSLTSSSLQPSPTTPRDLFLPSALLSNNTKLPPPLPLTSSLATLLQQKTTVSPSNNSSSKSHAAIVNSSNCNNNHKKQGLVKGSTGHGNSTHATNSHILVQNGQHFTIYKILAAPANTTSSSSSSSSSCSSSSGAAGAAAAAGTVTLGSSSTGSITSSSVTSQKGVTKRFLSAGNATTPNKRIHLDPGFLSNPFSSPSLQQHPRPVNGNSVLMNLLVNGEDVRNGYMSRKNAPTAVCVSNSASIRSRPVYSCPFD